MFHSFSSLKYYIRNILLYQVLYGVNAVRQRILNVIEYSPILFTLSTWSTALSYLH